MTGSVLALLDKDGWYEQPASLEGDPHWKKHAVNFGSGGAQMHVYDVNGDGLPDVITSLAAHMYGLAWFEQKKDASGEITFEKHLIMGDKPEQNRYGVKFSELHAVALVDMDGDGKKEILWQNSTSGDVTYWKLDGLTVSAAGYLMRAVPTVWQIRAAF